MSGADLKLFVGGCAPPLKEQIDDQHEVPWTEDALHTLDHFEEDSQAITRLNVRGLLADGKALQARQRLMVKITKFVGGLVQEAEVG